MTQEQKDLLLKDLCARLPYEVMAKFGDSNPSKITNITQCIDSDSNSCFIESEGESDGMMCEIDNVKPYLFTFTSMTEEQKNSFPFSYSFLEALIDGGVYFYEDECITLNDMIVVIQWCYKNHFDVHNFIPIGLAIDATGLNIY